MSTYLIFVFFVHQCILRPLKILHTKKVRKFATKQHKYVFLFCLIAQSSPFRVPCRKKYAGLKKSTPTQLVRCWLISSMEAAMVRGRTCEEGRHWKSNSDQMVAPPWKLTTPCDHWEVTVKCWYSSVKWCWKILTNFCPVCCFSPRGLSCNAVKTQYFWPKSQLFFTPHPFFGLRQIRLNGIISPPYPEAGRFMAPFAQSGPIWCQKVFTNCALFSQNLHALFRQIFLAEKFSNFFACLIYGSPMEFLWQNIYPDKYL